MKLKISEIFELYGGETDGTNASAERIAEMTLKRIHEESVAARPRKMSKPLKFTLIAAAAIVLILGGAMAAISSLPTGTDALHMANRELHALKATGILTGDFKLPEEGCQISLSGDLDNPYHPWLKIWGRAFNPFYNISYYDDDSSVMVSIDTVSGKLTGWRIQAKADEDEMPIRSRVLEDGQVINWYANYDDIFSSEMTVDELCGKLCEYWGFSGYTIGETETEYGQSCEIIDGTAPLKDAENHPWVTVYFEGDQKGVPQYIEVKPLGNGAMMMVGYAHSLG